MDEIINEFLQESHENLDQLDRDFIELEKNPRDKELLTSIFRVIHTIKGTCGFLDFNCLEKVTHQGENLLSKLRDGTLILNADMVSTLLAMIDAVREMLACIEKTGKDGTNDYSDLIEQLTLCCSTQVDAPKTKKKKAPVEKTAVAPEKDISSVTAMPTEILIEEHLDEVEQNASVEEAAVTSIAAKDSSIRVNVDLLDNLMNLIGELVLSRNQIMQYCQSINNSNFFNSTQRLSLITTELQEKVMKTRLQPISNIWKKFPRMVRDVSTTLNKRVRVEMHGEDTEIDRSIIEAIKDPLTHILRNAIDHGIEKPEVRKQLGKEEEGCINLQAYHECGQVIIEISDNGHGVNLNAVKEKAVKLGWFNSTQLQQMNESSITQLILKPGFSTAAEITSISGRGVGMDVVKTQVEKIGGLLELTNQPGSGLSLKIKIPLTLSIIPVLIINCCSTLYAIPQVNVVELLLINNEDGGKIEWIYDLPVYRLRGKILPLFSLQEIFEDKNIEKNKEKFNAVVNIVVLQAGAQQFGLIVHEVNDSQDIVVKPLAKLLKSIGLYLGGTILGNGHVALILDAMGLAHRANLNSGMQKFMQQENAINSINNSRESFLVMMAANHQIALPLDWVARLEVFNKNTFEKAGTLQVIQYRNALMPLIDLKSVLYPNEQVELSDTLYVCVVVVHHKEEYIGIIVDEIIDTIEEEVAYNKTLSRNVVIATTVIKGKVTEILDLSKILEHLWPHSKKEAHAQQINVSLDSGAQQMEQRGGL